MKAFVVTALLTLSFGSNLMAATSKTCYPFLANQDGFNRVCVTIENTQQKDTEAGIEIYRFEKMVSSLDGRRVHRPQQQVCNNPAVPHCYRQYETFKIVAENQDVNVELMMNKTRRSNCLNGEVFIREQLRVVKLEVECPALPSWGNNEI